MTRSPSLARDAALFRMRRINRWLLAGTVVATGALTDVAAQAFPGRTIKRATPASPATPAPTATTEPRRRHRHHHHALTPPAQPPQTQTSPQVVEPVPGATSAPATTAPAAPVQSVPAAAPAPAPAPAPVVSGGS